ncbi:hypothetical protein B0T25DRAFT_533315 [Lasiosphaeria hispida]|uniref:Secreted protein n=1 Tax=Lasiosphaeria hispida TaxID=260671 RepID=A0AAJ0HQX0_9PEZI|nr:hypothetical protein B0T25DRAFT_533315 [Lasiosphaeria hispida]
MHSSPLLAVALAAVAVSALAEPAPAPMVTAAPDFRMRVIRNLNPFPPGVPERLMPRDFYDNLFTGWYDTVSPDLARSSECVSKYRSFLQGDGLPFLGSALGSWLATGLRTVVTSHEWFATVSQNNNRAAWSCDGYPEDIKLPEELSTAWERYTDGLYSWRTAHADEGHALATSCGGFFQPNFDFAVATNPADCTSRIGAYAAAFSETVTSNGTAKWTSASLTGVASLTSTSSIAAAAKETGHVVVAVVYAAGVLGAMAVL